MSLSITMKRLFIGFTSIELIEFSLGMANTWSYNHRDAPRPLWDANVLFLYFPGKVRTINQCDEWICNYQSIRQRLSPKLIDFIEEWRRPWFVLIYYSITIDIYPSQQKDIPGTYAGYPDGMFGYPTIVLICP